MRITEWTPNAPRVPPISSTRGFSPIFIVRTWSAPGGKTPQAWGPDARIPLGS